MESVDSILDHDVIAGATVKNIGTGSAEQYVVTGATKERIVSIAADEYVIAVATIRCELDRARHQTRCFYHVVAGECVDSQSVIRWFCTRDIDPCSQAEYRRAICVTSDRNHVTPVGAIDDHVVGLTVATAAGGLEVNVNFGDVGTR